MVDDGFSGYVDTGVDDFEEAEDVEEDEEERPKNKCAYLCIVQYVFRNLDASIYSEEGEGGPKGKGQGEGQTEGPSP